MKKCFQKDDLLLSDIRQAPSGPDWFHLWWLGQSGFLIKWQERYLLFDPYLSDALTKKYAATDKPHVRITERAIDPARLDFIHVVTSSHNHTDHLDAETLLPLMAANPALHFILPEANRSFVANRLGCDPAFSLGMNEGEILELDGFTFHAVPAAHEEIDRDEAGRCHYLGYVVRFGKFAVYHSGDTLLYNGMENLLRPFKVDVALLPINGADPKRRVAGNLNCGEAAHLGKHIGSKLVVPCHYDMFEFNSADPSVFVAHAERAGQPFRVLECGEGLRVA